MGSVKLNQRSEEDSLTLLADCLASIHDGKKFISARTRGGSTKSGASGTRDLAFDFVRLHATHVNQLARLGLVQADLGRRVLEAFFDALSPSDNHSNTSDVEAFSVKAGGNVERNLIIENESWPSDSKIEVRPTCFRQSDGKEFNHHVAVEPAEFTLASGAQQVVKLSFGITKEFMVGREYELTVNVVIGTRVVGQELLLMRIL